MTHLRWHLFAALLLLVACTEGTAFAKKEDGFVPPPYAERFGRSLLGVLPPAAVFIGLCAAAGAYFGPHSKAPIRRLLQIAGALLLLGCLVAAGDALNDELWNPWFFASAFLAFLPGITLILNARRPLPIGYLLLGLLMTIPTWIALLAVGMPVQEWAMRSGWPATW